MDGGNCGRCRLQALAACRSARTHAGDHVIASRRRSGRIALRHEPQHHVLRLPVRLRVPRVGFLRVGTCLPCACASVAGFAVRDERPRDDLCGCLSDHAPPDLGRALERRRCVGTFNRCSDGSRPGARYGGPGAVGVARGVHSNVRPLVASQTRPHRGLPIEYPWRRRIRLGAPRPAGYRLGDVRRRSPRTLRPERGSVMDTRACVPHPPCGRDRRGHRASDRPRPAPGSVPTGRCRARSDVSRRDGADPDARRR